MQDFQFSMCGNVTDEELVHLAVSLDGDTMCTCSACSKLQDFLSNPQSLALLLPCSRMERLHIHRKLAYNQNVDAERYSDVSAMLVKKLEAHPHAILMEDQFAICLGQQCKP